MLRPDSRAFRRGSSEVEHALGKGGVGGSIPPRGTIMSAAGVQHTYWQHGRIVRW